MDPHVFQRLGPVDVPLLVEAGLQLDDGGDLFPVLAGRYEGVDYGGFVADPIERLFDRHHLRVDGRPADEVQHGREAVVRVVEHGVALAEDGVERRSLRKRRRGTRKQRLVLQVGPPRSRSIMRAKSSALRL